MKGGSTNAGHQHRERSAQYRFSAFFTKHPTKSLQQVRVGVHMPKARSPVVAYPADRLAQNEAPLVLMEKLP